MIIYKVLPWPHTICHYKKPKLSHLLHKDYYPRNSLSSQPQFLILAFPWGELKTCRYKLGGAIYKNLGFLLTDYIYIYVMCFNINCSEKKQLMHDKLAAVYSLLNIKYILTYINVHMLRNRNRSNRLLLHLTH